MTPAPPILTPGNPVHPAPPPPRPGVVAARTPVSHGTTSPAVYTPWTALEKQAAVRLKAELQDALRGLEKAAQEAGTILDISAATAADAAGRLEAAAWSAWHKYMTMADETRTAVMGPAYAAYDQALSYAQAAYKRAMDDAESAYKSTLADARRAEADVKSIVA